eukprot:360488-Chlamydomonas_euryale.AAC.3
MQPHSNRTIKHARHQETFPRDSSTSISRSATSRRARSCSSSYSSIASRSVISSLVAALEPACEPRWLAPAPPALNCGVRG